MGPTEQNIVKQCRNAGLPIPDRIANAPSLRSGLSLYLSAFFDLDSERALGYGGVGRIPYLATVRYAEIHQFDEYQTESLLYFIRVLDTEHLKRLEENKPKGK